MAAKTKGIAQRNVHGTLLCFVEGEVQTGIQAFIIRKVIDGWRNDPFIDGEEASDHFHCTGSAKEVTRH